MKMYQIIHRMFNIFNSILQTLDAFLVQEDIKAALIINSEESCTEEAEDLSSADANEAEEG